jgi:hypothetical protein
MGESIPKREEKKRIPTYDVGNALTTDDFKYFGTLLVDIDMPATIAYTNYTSETNAITPLTGDLTIRYRDFVFVKENDKPDPGDIIAILNPNKGLVIKEYKEEDTSVPIIGVVYLSVFTLKANFIHDVSQTQNSLDNITRDETRRDLMDFRYDYAIIGFHTHSNAKIKPNNLAYIDEEQDPVVNEHCCYWIKGEGVFVARYDTQVKNFISGGNVKYIGFVPGFDFQIPRGRVIRHKST